MEKTFPPSSKTSGIDPYEMGNFYDENGGLADEHYSATGKAGFNRELLISS